MGRSPFIWSENSYMQTEGKAMDYVEERKRQRLSQITSIMPKDITEAVLMEELKKPGVLFWKPGLEEIKNLAKKLIQERR